MKILGNTSSGGKYSDAPTIGAVTAGNAQVSVAFTAPTYAGKGTVTYTVTASPGGATASGSSSPIVVTGLNNGTSYTFTVTATTNYGVSSFASSSSSSATPEAPPPSFAPDFPPDFTPDFPPDFTVYCSSCTPSGSYRTHSGCPGSGNCTQGCVTYSCLPSGCVNCNCPDVCDGACSGPSCP